MTGLKRDGSASGTGLAFSHATELADYFMQQYLAGEVDEVHLVYNEFRFRRRAAGPCASSCCRSRARDRRRREAGTVSYIYERIEGDPRRSAAAARAAPGVRALME